MDPGFANERCRQLVRQLQHGEIDRRWHAARILGEQGETSVDYLLVLLYNDDPGVRILALWALGRTRSVRAVTQIKRMLEDEEPDVRIAGEGALQRICGRSEPRRTG